MNQGFLKASNAFIPSVIVLTGTKRSGEKKLGYVFFKIIDNQPNDFFFLKFLVLENSKKIKESKKLWQHESICLDPTEKGRIF